VSQGTAGYGGAGGAGGGWGAHLGGDLVSGEAVLLELRLAWFPSRALARLIDLAIQIALVFATVFLVAQADIGDSAASAVVILVLYIALLVGYPLAFETLTQGRTPGKMALGLRVVRDDGGSTRVRHALVRALVGVIEIWILPFVAILTSLVSTKGKRVGDYLAGTVVVRERVPQTSVPYVQMPPALAPWAAGLELSRLPDQLALAARQLLGRASDISPQARAQMAERIAYDVSRFVAPPPPPGCPPEAYLAAVLAERRRREIARTTPAPAYGVAPTAVASGPGAVAPLPPPVQAQADPYGFHPPA
jgi:uncharacterized RDD family membrane protein YckC